MRPPPNLHRQALTIVALYAGAAGTWIALSDRLLGAFVGDPDTLVRISLVKGIAFVVATAGILYLLLRRTFRKIERALLAVQQKEAERLLHEEERQRAEAIVESTDDAIISTTAESLITSWNPAAERLFGFTAQEMLGQPLATLIPSELQQEASELVSRFQAGQRVEHIETLRLRRDGTCVPVAITFSPMWASGTHELIGVSEIVRDVTRRKAAEAIAERERRFASSLIEAMPGVFYLYDQKLRFLRWNQNFERVSGYSAPEIEHMQPLDFFPDANKRLVEARIAEVFTAGEASVEASFATKGGQTVPYFFTGKRITFDGQTCLIGVGLDIEQRLRAEDELRKSAERHRSTLDNILEGCQVLDSDWRYLYLNDAAATQNRRANAELLGKRMPDAWPGIEGTTVFAMLKQTMEQRQPLRAETEFRFPDGDLGWFDIRTQPVPEGVLVLSVDVSERRQAEQALREINSVLELKIAERTRDLDAAKERAEAADRLKSAFLATMSHELRTPLNSIIGFTGIILQRLAGPLTPEQTKQLSMVQGSAKHLLALINDVLDISKIEAGQLEIRIAPFDLRKSLGRVAESFTPLAQSKGLRLQVMVPDTEIAIESDQRRVEQILLNLVNNALKFTELGEVRVTARIDSTEGIVRIAVEDTGIGIKEHDLSQLFQPFRQIDSGLQRRHEGTGLGLAICRRLAERLGATIKAESSWGRGSTFTLVLPLKHPPV